MSEVPVLHTDNRTRRQVRISRLLSLKKIADTQRVCAFGCSVNLVEAKEERNGYLGSELPMNKQDKETGTPNLSKTSRHLLGF